ncbi:phage tail protein [Bacillus subtilis subsp. subtilis]
MRKRINRNIKVDKLKLSLTTTNKKKIANVIPFFFASTTENFGSGYNELTFEIPIIITKRHVKKRNHVADILKVGFLIKTYYRNEEHWYVITNVDRNQASESNRIGVSCKSLHYLLYRKKIEAYENISRNLTEVATDCLKSTGWSIGYVNEDFNIKRRSFEETSTNRLDLLYKIAETFDATLKFDTANEIVHFYKKEELSKFKHVKFKPGQFLISVSDPDDLDEVVTRLRVVGKDGIGINSVNPTGQAYIDDFSFFLYPFERDENRNILKSSDRISDELAHKILDYNELINKNSERFKTLLEEKLNLDKQKAELETQKATLEIERKQLLDKIEVAKKAKDPIDELKKQLNSKLEEVNENKAKIKSIENKISKNSTATENLRDTLSQENFFGEKLIGELSKIIFEDTWTNDNIFDESDLYEAGLKEMETRSSPPINITNLSVYNFFKCIDHQYYWDKFDLGDIIQVVNEELGINAKATITQIVINFDESTMSLSITNGKRAESALDKQIKSKYKIQKAATEYNQRKLDYEKVYYNFNQRNDQISTPVEPPTLSNQQTLSHTVNDNGSVDITVEWDYPDDYTIDKNNIDGFRIIMYASGSSDQYIFGATMANENSLTVEREKRKAVFTSLTPNKYYTFGVQAYRSVDPNIATDGYIRSDIIVSSVKSENPYLPSNSVEVKGSLSGKVNGLYTISTETKPISPDAGTIWIDSKTNKQELFNGEEWIVSSAGSADSLNGYTASTLSMPNSIPVRNDQGIITGSIDGNAEFLGGKLHSEYALSSDVPQMAQGTYVGDGTISKQILLPFTPTLVKVYPLSMEDSVLLIDNDNGGHTYQVNELGISLVGGISTYGSINELGFLTGSDSNQRGNKLNTKYIWEAYRHVH